jgi:hypothetical protein
MAAEDAEKADSTARQAAEPPTTDGPAPPPKPYRSLMGIWKGKVKITDADIRAVRKAMWDPKRLKEKFDL